MGAEFGFCMICDKEIAPKCGSCDTRKPGGEYTQVEVQWSNGSKMLIAVCLSCATSHAWTTPEAKKGITQAHWDHWDKEGGKYDREIVIV